MGTGVPKSRGPCEPWLGGHMSVCQGRVLCTLHPLPKAPNLEEIQHPYSDKGRGGWTITQALTEMGDSTVPHSISDKGSENGPNQNARLAASCPTPLSDIDFFGGQNCRVSPQLPMTKHGGEKAHRLIYLKYKCCNNLNIKKINAIVLKVSQITNAF